MSVSTVAMKPQFVDSDGNPLKNIYLYVQHRKVPNKIWKFKLNDNGKFDGDRKIFVNDGGTDYELYPSAFELKTSLTTDSTFPLTIIPEVTEDNIKGKWDICQKKYFSQTEGQKITLSLRPVHKELYTFVKKELDVAKWNKILWNDLFESIVEHICNPYKVEQLQTPYCGPCSVIFELVRRKPGKYVEILADLFYNGSFTSGREYKPTDKLLNSQIDKGLSAADWMLAATLRETENLFIHIENGRWSIVEDVGGITINGSVEKWTRDLIGLNPKYFSSIFFGETSALDEAARIVSNNGVAFMLIDMDLTKTVETIIDFPTHWIAFLGDYSKTMGPDGSINSISFTYFTWGGARHFSAPKEKYVENMFGVVVGR